MKEKIIKNNINNKNHLQFSFTQKNAKNTYVKKIYFIRMNLISNNVTFSDPILLITKQQVKTGVFVVAGLNGGATDQRIKYIPLCTLVNITVAGIFFYLYIYIL